MTPRYSVIIPAHNEAERIEPTLRDYCERFSDADIIVVLNGCTDATAEVVRPFTERHRNVRMIDVGLAIGKGGAVRVGCLFALGELIGFVDADGSTAAVEMRRLFSLVGPGVDGIIASRWMRASKIVARQTLLRRLMSRSFNFLTRLLFGLPFVDTQCGAKVFRADVLKAVWGDLEVSNLAFDVELLHRLAVDGRTVLEEPTVWSDVSGSRVHPLRAPYQMFVALARLKLRASFLRFALPLFDRLIPTKPVRVRSEFSVMVVTNIKDGPHVVELAHILNEWASHGHRIAAVAPSDSALFQHSFDARIDLQALPSGWRFYPALAAHYLTRHRDVHDVVLEVINDIPCGTSFYSMKPKIVLAAPNKLSATAKQRFGSAWLRAFYGAAPRFPLHSESGNLQWQHVNNRHQFSDAARFQLDVLDNRCSVLSRAPGDYRSTAAGKASAAEIFAMMARRVAADSHALVLVEPERRAV